MSPYTTAKQQLSKNWQCSHQTRDLSISDELKQKSKSPVQYCGLFQLSNTIMTSQKQHFPSFASTISVLAIVFYCAGFLRVELELNNQRKRLNALQHFAESKPSSSDPSFTDKVNQE